MRRGTRAPIVAQDNNRLLITIPLRRGVDLVSFVSEVVTALTGASAHRGDGSRGGSTTIKVADYRACFAVNKNSRMSCRHQMRLGLYISKPATT